MCFPPVQNGQEMRIFLFIHRNRPVEVVQSSWITALTQQTDPCGGTKRFLKCTFQGGLPLHQLHLGCEAGTEFSQLQWRLIFDPFPFHCISWALNHCCAEQFHSASQLEFHPLKKVVLYLDLDLLLSILHFSLLLSRLFFHNKPKFHRTECLGRSFAPIFISSGDQNISFSPLTPGAVYRADMSFEWLLSKYIFSASYFDAGYEWKS